MGFPLLLYNLVLLVGLTLGFPAVLVYLAFSPKARRGLSQKLGRYPADFLSALSGQAPGKKRLWFHAVSVGEFNAIRPLVAELQEEYHVVVSTTTQTGQALAKRIFPELPVFYFPHDLRPVIHQALKTVQPDAIVITETELWPNFIDVATRRHSLPVLLINGRISKGSYKGYKSIRPLIRSSLQQLTHLYMQSQGDANRIADLGELAPERLTVVGNLKFDVNPQVDPVQKGILAHLLSVSPKEPILIMASTHAGEDAPLIEAYQRLHKCFTELKLIIAPRHPERAGEIKTILAQKALHFSLRSQLNEANPNRCNIVVLDTIGELLTVYSLCSVAVMGGSFVEKGGQNPLEPLSVGIPVIFGPHMSNFTEITRLILENHAGYQVANTEVLGDVVTELLTQPEIYSTTVENGQQLIDNNRGAKEILASAIKALLG